MTDGPALPPEVVALLGDEAALLRERLEALAQGVEERLARRLVALEEQAASLTRAAKQAERVAESLRAEVASRDRRIAELERAVADAEGRAQAASSALAASELRLSKLISAAPAGSVDKLQNALLRKLGADAPDVVVSMPLLELVDVEPLPVLEGALPLPDPAADLRVGNWSFYREAGPAHHQLPAALTVPEAVAHARRSGGLRAVVLWVKDAHATCVARLDDGSVYSSYEDALAAARRLGVPDERVLFWEHSLDVASLQSSLNAELELSEDESLTDWLSRTGCRYIDRRDKKGMLRITEPSDAFEPAARRLRAAGIYFNLSRSGEWWTSKAR